MTACIEHTGAWYGGPGMWCRCRTQDCGYCGSVLAVDPGPADDYSYRVFDEQDRVVIDIDDLKARIAALPEPTLGLKGGISRQAVIDLIDGLVPS